MPARVPAEVAYTEWHQAAAALCAYSYTEPTEYSTSLQLPVTRVTVPACRPRSAECTMTMSNSCAVHRDEVMPFPAALTRRVHPRWPSGCILPIALVDGIDLAALNGSQV